MLKLTLRGGFTLTTEEGTPIAIRSRKARGLLAVLARPIGQVRSRDEILALLWSDRAEPQARASLRQVLAGLRVDLGPEAGQVLRITAEAVALDPAGVVEVPGGPGAEFLAGLQIRDPAFDEWLRDARLAEAGPPPGESGDGRVLSLAILPFANQSPDPEQEYFADGLTEDLIAAMGRFHGLGVIARNSAFQYKGTAPLASEVGTALGVDYLVEGSVRAAGQRIRIAAQLTETEGNTQLWAERYDRDLSDVFAVQDDVVAAIAAQLGVTLTAAAVTRTTRRPPQALTAYDRLLRGRAAWWRGNAREGFRLVEEAAAIDPTLAAAQAWLALQYAYEGFSGAIGLDPESLGSRSRALARRALDLDDRDPFVHMAASMAFGFTQGGDKDRGLSHIETAAALNPHDSEIMLLRAWHLGFLGELDRALDLIGGVRRFNPLGSPVISECLADILYMKRDYAGCLATYGDWYDAPLQVRVVFAACHAQMGAPDLAHRSMDDLSQVAGEGFDPVRFARMQIAVSSAREDIAAHWRDGFRKAGVAV